MGLIDMSVVDEFGFEDEACSLSLAKRALVACPKFPVAGVILLAFWNFISAFFVKAPKYVDSFPTEPVPVGDIIKPLELRSI